MGWSRMANKHLFFKDGITFRLNDLKEDARGD